MRLSPLFAFLGLSAVYGSTALATITLQFSQASVGWIASNFANAAGTPTDGMNWGVLIDTTGNGFKVDSYSAFTVTTDGFLSAGGVVTDDYYFHSTALTLDTSASTESGGISGAHGTITLLASVPFAGATGITTGDSFGLVWFSTNSANTGDKYGFLTKATAVGASPGFQIQADGSTTNYSQQFVGVDPVQTASHSIAPVPEPATSFLLGSGLLLFAARRSRR